MKLISKRIWITALILLLPYLFIMVICLYKTENEAIMTGGISNVEDLIEIKSDYKEEGTFNSVYVLTYRGTSILQNWILGNSNKNDTQDISYENYLSNKEISAQGTIYHDSSVMYSLIHAYNEASQDDDSIHLDYKLSGFKIYYRSKNSKLRIDDFIVKVNDIDVRNDTEGFINAFYNLEVGDIFTIIRDNEEIEVPYERDPSNNNGFRTYDYYDINYKTSYPQINVNAASSSGPSAGLLQTLSIFNRLQEQDYTSGLTICGTGTIDTKGNVGAIGGIKQKVITASNNKVDVFFCPKDNEEEGLSAYNSLPTKKRKKMSFVVVQTFSDATNYLRGLYEKLN